MARRTTLCLAAAVGLAAAAGLAAAVGLALLGSAAAQTRLAVTAPTGNVDPLDEMPATPSLPPMGGGVEPSPPVGTGLRPPNAVPPPVTGPAPDVAKAPAAAARELRGNPLWAIPLRSLNYTRERPLFSPSRRPPAPAVVAPPPPPRVVAAKPPEPDRPQLALIGLVVGANDGVAILVDQTTREVVRLRKDQAHEGWILRSIKDREVVLEKAERTAVLALPAPGAEPAAPALPPPPLPSSLPPSGPYRYQPPNPNAPRPPPNPQEPQL